MPRLAFAESSLSVGRATLSVISDGHLVLPTNFLQPPNVSTEEFQIWLKTQSIVTERIQSACNITLWRHGDALVLFDVGAGGAFMDSAGQLLDGLEAAGVAAEDITDVVITHAHPDHLWGLVDDFDELVFPEANYHMHESEWDFWWADDTVDKMPEARKVFAVGAKNRFNYLADRIQLFSNGDEPVSGVEAVLTAGHTPGHTSFALHSEGNSAMVIGDALTHPVLAFEKTSWLNASDHDPLLAAESRKGLLDRLATDKTPIIGYHLPYPGLGQVQRDVSAYRFEPS